MPSFGRLPIFTDESVINASNVLRVVRKSAGYHGANAQQIMHLHDVYVGNQRILMRKKQVRPEINNKLVANHANEIVAFKVSYLLAEPIVYVNRGSRNVSEEIAKLNEYMYLEGKASQDKEIADDFNVGGNAYRLVLPNRAWSRDTVDEAPFKVYTLNPALTFLIRGIGLGHPVLAGVTATVKDSGAITYSVYTDRELFTIENDAITKVERHALGMVPIVEYINNNDRIGSFEVVETLLDAINALESNRLDATEQVVQALMIFKNCDIDADGLEQLRQSGAIKLVSNGSVDADVTMLTAALQQADQQVLLDSLYKTVRTIVGMPSSSDGNTSDSSNNGAVYMRNGWYGADARAKDDELLWRRSENEFLRIVLRICRDMADLDLSLADVGVKFTRRNYEDLMSKAQCLQLLLQSGIAPEYAIAQCGMFSDPTEVYEASKDYLEKWSQPAPSAYDTAAQGTDEEEDDEEAVDDE